MPPVNPATTTPHRNDGLPIMYRLGLLLVAVGMIVLTLVYIALTALACQWVWFFATHYFLDILNWPIRGLYGTIAIVVCARPYLLRR